MAGSTYNLNISARHLYWDWLGFDLKGIKGIKVLFLAENGGKGAALKTGIAKSSGDIIIVQDADLEYSPDEYSELIKPIVGEKTKVVYGSRLLNKKNRRGRLLFYLGDGSLLFLQICYMELNLLMNQLVTRFFIKV